MCLTNIALSDKALIIKGIKRWLSVAQTFHKQHVNYIEVNISLPNNQLI